MQLINMETVFDEDGDKIPEYGVLTAKEVQDLEDVLLLNNKEEAIDQIDRLQFLTKSAKWFTLYPEYVDPPDEVILDNENYDYPYATNVDVIVAPERHRFENLESVLKKNALR